MVGELLASSARLGPVLSAWTWRRGGVAAAVAVRRLIPERNGQSSRCLTIKSQLGVGTNPSAVPVRHQHAGTSGASNAQMHEAGSAMQSIVVPQHNNHHGSHHDRVHSQRWVPPGRWTHPGRTTSSSSDWNKVDDYRKVEYALSEWPRRPLPTSVDTALKRILTAPKFSYSEDLLTRVADRLFEMPKPRIEPELHTGKRAAVMLPLCEVRGEPSVLFTLRSQNVGTHKGQVSFPGGHLDLDDECMEGCAQRECEEELGVRVEAPRERSLWEATWKHRPYYPRSNIIGRLPNCVAITGTLVTPIVGYLGQVKVSHLERLMNKSEIDDVFTMPLRELLNPHGVVHENIHMGNRMPAFISGKHKVWGLTAYILHHFLMEVMVPALLVRKPRLQPSESPMPTSTLQEGVTF